MHRFVSPLHHRLLLVAAAASFGLSLPASAGPAQDVQQLIRQGQHTQALEQIDKMLVDKPRDAQGRFLRGVVLTEMGRTQEAISLFSKLTEDYPNLPEPYNNLAVIYAQQKQYDKAKQSLEKAIRTHPAYATAHENLGDIYARMASQAYDKALQLDSANATAQTKLAMIKDLIGVSARGATAKPTATANAQTPPAAPAAPTASVSVAPPAPKPPEPAKVAVVTPVQPPPAVAAPAETKPAAVAATPTVAAAAIAPQVPPTKPQAPAKPVAGDGPGDVGKVINSWAGDWSKKDVKAYLSHYAKDFKTPGGSARSEWEAERTQRIRKPGTIQVNVEGLKISVEGGERATARFRQFYKSAGLKTSSNKTLELVKRDGRWQIQQERIGN
ncbi:MAG: tetratricopeptide repeat protein [Rhodocyclaceae bacterium]|nr:tetratricopeptide repeat protein [Rhodocyclaceae bacterium]